MRSCIKSGSVVSERVYSFSVFLFMSPTWPGYKEFNLATPTTPMAEGKEDEGARDPIKIMLEEALEKQRNGMMGNSSQILQCLPTGGTSTSSMSANRSVTS